jgi:hypothetical protein
VFYFSLKLFFQHASHFKNNWANCDKEMYISGSWVVAHGQTDREANGRFSKFCESAWKWRTDLSDPGQKLMLENFIENCNESSSCGRLNISLCNFTQQNCIIFLIYYQQSEWRVFHELMSWQESSHTIFYAHFCNHQLNIAQYQMKQRMLMYRVRGRSVNKVCVACGKVPSSCFLGNVDKLRKI